MSLHFPKEFKFGFSESGFQFEMGLPGSEDPNSDWWVWVHDSENIMSGLVSGDFPEDGPAYWHLYKKDHDRAEKLGMDAARISVEWSRIFPKSTFDVKVDVEETKEGIVSVNIEEKHLKELDELANRGNVEHYRKIFSDWKNRDKTLIVNLYHWPLPLWIHHPVKFKMSGFKERKGWLDKQIIVEFTKYTAYIAWKFEDLVDMWSTMNEPNVVYIAGYLQIKTGFPPAYLSLPALFTAMKNMAEAHARAYDVIKSFSKMPVGLIHSVVWFEPLSPEDKEAAEAIAEDYMYRFLDLITTGKLLGMTVREDLKNHLDWLGVNYYSRIVVKKASEKHQKIGIRYHTLPDYGLMCRPNSKSLAGRPTSDYGWELYPEGLEKILLTLNERYKVPMIVTENGIADSKDVLRANYIVSHLYRVYTAIKRGVNVLGYLHWALTDNYEWSSGFKTRFGLYHVNYENKKRYLRPSALIFKAIAEEKTIPNELTHLTTI